MDEFRNRESTKVETCVECKEAMTVLNDVVEFVDVVSKYRQWDWDLELFITTILEESADGDVEPVLAKKSKKWSAIVVRD